MNLQLSHGASWDSFVVNVIICVIIFVISVSLEPHQPTRGVVHK